MAINKTASLVFTGTRRYWDVPDIIEEGTITYSISGGGGGTGGNDSHSGGSGSNAGYVRGTFTIAAGQRINIGVGGAGSAGVSTAANAAGGSGGQSLTGFSGGTGGKSGQYGTSGAGGGGGGATVIKIGETLIAVAGGGGGGGGGGNLGDAVGKSSPNYPVPGQNVDRFLGQNGAPHNGDGGGGGGGGGGWNAGTGGGVVSGDVGGNCGYQGHSAGLNSTSVTFVEDTRQTIDTRVTTTTAGWVGGVIFNTRGQESWTTTDGSNPENYAYSNGAYGGFLNSYGIWEGDINGPTYDRTYNVNFPVAGHYTVQASWDNAGAIYIDGDLIVSRFTGDDSGTYRDITENTVYVAAGYHAVRLYADNYGGPGCIGCLITGVPIAATTITTGELITTGSLTTRNAGVGAGVSGYADLYLTARLSRGIRVRVNNTWTTAKEIYTKIDGAWKKTSQVYVKIDGDWKPAYIRGGDNLIRFEFSSTSDMWGDSTGAPASGTSRGGEPADPDPDPPAAAPGGGGGGSCKIICQKLAEMGFFDKSMNEADQKFGRILREQDPDAYNGYIRWAQPVVELLEGKGSATFRKVAFFWVRDEKRRQKIQSNIVAHYLDVIARPWAEEMAYRMKAEGYDKSNPAGRFIMNIGLPMCRSIGRFNKHRESPMWLKTALIWGITTVLLVAVSTISMIDKAFNKICKIFGRS